MKNYMNTENKDTDAEPRITINGYKVTAVNCQSDASARELAEERIREIDKRIAEIKAERTALNRQKHLLVKAASLELARVS